MNMTLVVLAAGMGSRYGGLKQMAVVGAQGQCILDYSLHDAILAGFNRVIFVIRRDFEAVFRDWLGDRFHASLKIELVFQDVNDLPEGFACPEGRTKPWGTAHAVWSARHYITEPFAVINADDFYGAEAYQSVREFFLQASQNLDQSKIKAAMVAYHLGKTLSPNGTVNRGVCKVSEKSSLKQVEEHEQIQIMQDQAIHAMNAQGKAVVLEQDTLVSMNFWAFEAKFILQLEQHFIHFLKTVHEATRTECYLPFVVDACIQMDQLECQVLVSRGAWAGVTYPEDLAYVQEKLENLAFFNVLK